MPDRALRHVFFGWAGEQRALFQTDTMSGTSAEGWQAVSAVCLHPACVHKPCSRGKIFLCFYKSVQKQCRFVEYSKGREVWRVLPSAQRLYGIGKTISAQKPDMDGPDAAGILEDAIKNKYLLV